MQRLIEQPVGEGDVFGESGRVGRFHYHLAVYRHFSDEAGEPVPPHLEVEGRVTALRDPEVVGGLHRLGIELTLRLADGRALDFKVVHEDGSIHSTGRGLYTPDQHGRAGSPDD
jgi:hypothetical protein